MSIKKLVQHDLLREYVRSKIWEARASQAKKVDLKSSAPLDVPAPDWAVFTQLAHDIVGNALTISSDINEIAAVATVNKGSPVNASDVASHAKGGSASSVIAERFQEVLTKALAAGYSKKEASAYIAGELARGSAMGMAALQDCGGGEASWTADRGADLADFVQPGTKVSPKNPSDFVVETDDGRKIGYSAKATAGAASNFSNPSLASLEILAGFPLKGGIRVRSPQVAAVYASAIKDMNKAVPGFSGMSPEEKKKYREVAKDLGLYDKVQSGTRDVLLAAIQQRLATREPAGDGEQGKDPVEQFLRSVVPDLPNPPFKVVFGKKLGGAVIKPPSAAAGVALHLSTSDAKLTAKAAGSSGITFVSSAGGKLFTFRIKMAGGFGSSLKGAVTA